MLEQILQHTAPPPTCSLSSTCSLCSENTSLCFGSSQRGYEREVEGKFCWSQSSRECSCCSLLNDTVNSPALTALLTPPELLSSLCRWENIFLLPFLQLEEDCSSSKSHWVSEPCAAAAETWHCTLWGKTARAGPGPWGVRSSTDISVAATQNREHEEYLKRHQFPPCQIAEFLAFT